MIFDWRMMTFDWKVIIFSFDRCRRDILHAPAATWIASHLSLSKQTQVTRRCPTECRWKNTLIKIMNFVLEMMNFVLKMTQDSTLVCMQHGIANCDINAIFYSNCSAENAERMENRPWEVMILYWKLADHFAIRGTEGLLAALSARDGAGTAAQIRGGLHSGQVSKMMKSRLKSMIFVSKNEEFCIKT